MNGRVAFFRKYAMLLRAEWAVMFAYRSESLIWLVGSFVQPVVSLSVWLSISGGGTLNGYAAKDYVLYFLGVLLVERLTSSWDVWELDSDIRQGTLSAKLLRPFHPVHWSIAQNLVYKCFFAMLLIPVWLLLAWVWPLFRLPHTALLLPALGALLGAMALRFLIGYELGLLAFWTSKATAIYALYEGVHLFLAGRIAPLTLLPEGVAKAAAWLPFYATIGFPVDLLTGKLTGQPERMVQGFTQQAVWIVVLLLLFRLEWKKGLRQFSAAGG